MTIVIFSLNAEHFLHVAVINEHVQHVNFDISKYKIENNQKSKSEKMINYVVPK